MVSFREGISWPGGYGFLGLGGLRDGMGRDCTVEAGEFLA